MDVKQIPNSTAMLVRLRNGEHYLLHRNVIGDVTEEIAEAQHLTASRTEYVGEFLHEEATYHQNQGYVNTAEVVSTDLVRDEAFLFLRHSVDANLYSKDEAKRAAATQLSYALKPFRMANSKTYSENTSQIYKLVAVLQEDENASAITTLGLDDIVTDLEEANEQFNTTFKTRSSAKLERKSQMNMKTVRPRVDAAFKKLVDDINVLYKANEIAYNDEETRTVLGNLIDKISSYIVEMNDILARRGSDVSSDVPEPSPEPTPQPAEPVIKRIYMKENANPDNQNEMQRGKVAVIECENVNLLDSTGENPGDLIFTNSLDTDSKVDLEDILEWSTTRIEFRVIPYISEGKYRFRIETYYNGEGNPPLEKPTVIDYPVTLNVI